MEYASHEFVQDLAQMLTTVQQLSVCLIPWILVFNGGLTLERTLCLKPVASRP
jgi:hypothetical protein